MVGEQFDRRQGRLSAGMGQFHVKNVPAARKGNTAAARIGASTTDDPAVAPY